VSNVERMESMFARAMAFNQDLCNWRVDKLEHIRNMFYESGMTRLSRFINKLSGKYTRDEIIEDVIEWEMYDINMTIRKHNLGGLDDFLRMIRVQT